MAHALINGGERVHLDHVVVGAHDAEPRARGASAHPAIGIDPRRAVGAGVDITQRLGYSAARQREHRPTQTHEI